jgi:NAD-dependent SIR2 family protein deacetylase
MVMGDAKRMQDLGFKMNHKANQPQQIQVDLRNATPQVCSKCGSNLFQPAIMLFSVSALLSPTGQELLAQQPVLVCLNCREQFTGEKKVIEP